MVLSEFTLALFEDSGWYKANYTAFYNLQQNPLQWGKGKALYIATLSFSNVKYLIHFCMTGLGCDFLTQQCSDHSIFPYLCDTNMTQLVCTYDHLTKVCRAKVMSLSKAIIL